MSVTQTIHFDPAGGALSVRAQAGYAAVGSYGILLTEHDGASVVQEWKGHFSSANQNTHQFPGTAADNDGRVIDLVASVGLMDATRAYGIYMTLLQNGNELGTMSDAGVDATTNPTHESALAAALSGAQALMALNASAVTLIARAKPRVGRRAKPRSVRLAQVRQDAKSAATAAKSRVGNRAAARRGGK